MWEDIDFKEDEIWITLNGKTGERDIPVRTAKPLMEEYWENSDCTKKDPVFRKKNRTNFCPECGKQVDLKGSKCAYEDREYRCPECNWEGPIQDVKKEKRPLTDDAVRRILEKLVKKAGYEGEFKNNPHHFFRKSRAIHKARIGWTEHQIRSFFGWTITSSAPKHYISTAKEDLEKALAVEYGEEVDYENDYKENALRPVECISCKVVNSATNDLCKECGNPLTEQGEDLTGRDTEKSLRDILLKRAESEDMNEEEFEELLDTPVIEAMKK